MARKKHKLSDELRAAVLKAPITRYEISKRTGIPESSLSRFVSGAGGLSLDSIDKIADCLGLHLAGGRLKRRKRGK